MRPSLCLCLSIYYYETKNLRLQKGFFMDKEYLQYLVDTITDKDNLKKVNEEALKLSSSYSPEEYIQIASELYCSEYFQIQEISVLLYGYASSMSPTALEFLRETVSTHPSWKVQEVLAMAFDIYCSTNGYKNSLPTIEEWLQDSRPNVRRAVSEGLRIWTNRDYFRENPQIAISLLSNLKADIDYETFDKVQTLLQRDTRTSPKGREVHLFSGFLKCANCGRAINRSQSGKNIYYACSTYKNRSRTACTMHSIKHERLEAAVLFAVQHQVHLAVSYSEIVAQINSAPIKKSQSYRLDDLIAAKERELTKITRYKQSLYQDWKDGEITQQEYRYMKSDYERQTSDISAVLTRLNTERAELANGVDNEHPALVAFILKLSCNHSTGTNNAALAQHCALQYDTIAPYKAIFANLDFSTWHQITIAAVFISQELVSRLCLNRMEVVVENLAVSTNAGVLTNRDLFSSVDRCAAYSYIIANLNLRSRSTGDNNRPTVKAN